MDGPALKARSPKAHRRVRLGHSRRSRISLFVPIANIEKIGPKTEFFSNLLEAPQGRAEVERPVMRRPERR
jgi:hypothetical protein